MYFIRRKNFFLIISLFDINSIIKCDHLISIEEHLEQPLLGMHLSLLFKPLIKLCHYVNQVKQFLAVAISIFTSFEIEVDKKFFQKKFNVHEDTDMQMSR
jgi:hypothetical protein